jgi:hypothetical protein
MGAEILVALLFGMTLLAVLVFALYSRKKTRDAIDDPNDPKSALAKDGPTGKVEDRL